MSDLDRPSSGVRDMKRQCRGLGMAGEVFSSILTHSLLNSKFNSLFLCERSDYKKKY